MLHELLEAAMLKIDLEVIVYECYMSYWKPPCWKYWLRGNCLWMLHELLEAAMLKILIKFIVYVIVT
jgi:hypothetical protein